MVLVVSPLVSGSQAMSLSSEIIVDVLAFTIRIGLETIGKIGSKQRPYIPAKSIAWLPRYPLSCLTFAQL